MDGLSIECSMYRIDCILWFRWLVQVPRYLGECCAWSSYLQAGRWISTETHGWGEPERAPHRRDIHARIVYIYIYIYMYGTTVTRGAAHTQYTVPIPKYSAQYRPHVVMFASSTAQACNIHCHVFEHRSSYVCRMCFSSNRDR